MRLFCSECNAPLVLTPSHLLSCPAMHGKLLPCPEDLTQHRLRRAQTYALAPIAKRHYHKNQRPSRYYTLDGSEELLSRYHGKQADRPANAILAKLDGILRWFVRAG